MKKYARAAQPIQLSIGKFNLCIDLNNTGDLQIRVYPIAEDGQIWDCPFETFDVLHADVEEAEILAAEEEAFRKKEGE